MRSSIAWTVTLDARRLAKFYFWATVAPLKVRRLNFQGCKAFKLNCFPSNSTSKVQTLDAGIIASVKATFRRRLLSRVSDNMDTGNKFM